MTLPRDGDPAEGRLPLTGVRVLDLGDEAVVFAARLLTDLGAEVVRIESAGGDRIRRRPPFLDGEPGIERSLAHLRYNAGKQSVALALDTPAAWEIVDRLAAAVDVVIAPLEKHDLAQRFFDDRRMRTVHPGLGVVDTVFRRDSAHTATTDLIGVAAGGLLYLNGFPEDPPNVPAGKLAYKQVSLTAALAAMSLVMARQRAGRAGRITVAMQEAVMWTTIQTANENYWHWHHTRPTRTGLRGLGGRSIFPTRDGRWVSFTIPPPYWHSYTAWIAEATGRTEFQGEQWRERQYQIAHVAETAEATAALCASMTRDQLVEEGQRRHLLVLPVNGVADVSADPHLRARGFFEEVDYPQFGRSLSMPAPPFLSSRYRATTKPAPTLGQHSVSVLQRLAGLDERAIAARIADCTVAASGEGVPVGAPDD
jgi:benzylsuccinate CoA-transferase BbsE subunit